MLKALVWLVILTGLGYAATCIGLGAPHKLASPGWPYSTTDAKLTFAGHVRAIWHTEQVQDLKDGLVEKAGPAAQDLRHKLHEVTADDPTGATPGSGSGSGSGASGSAVVHAP